jgi:hypothetical protein
MSASFSFFTVWGGEGDFYAFFGICFSTEGLLLQRDKMSLSLAPKKETQRNRQGGSGTAIFEKSEAFFKDC